MQITARLWRVAVFAAAFIPLPASAVTIRQLTAANGSITVGDKLFNNFRTSRFNVIAGDVDPLTSLDIDVQPLIDGSEFGLLFGPLRATYEPSGSLAIGNWDFGFDVLALNPAMRISAVRQRFTLIHSGGARGGNVMSDVKSCPFVFCNQPGEVQVFLNDSLAGGESSPTVKDEFRVLDIPQPDLSVETDVFLQAGAIGETDPTSIQNSGIGILFTQTAVPEPGTLSLLSVAFAISALSARRRGRTKH